MIRAILFDMDGVLVDSIKAWFTTFNMTLKKFEGKEITLKEFESDVWAQDFNITRTKYFSADKSLVDSYFYSLQPKLLDMMERDEKVCSALKLLKEKYVLAVVTNTQTSLAEKVLSKLEIIGFFSKVIGIGKDMKGKPEPDIVLLALERLIQNLRSLRPYRSTVARISCSLPVSILSTSTLETGALMVCSLFIQL